MQEHAISGTELPAFDSRISSA